MTIEETFMQNVTYANRLIIPSSNGSSVQAPPHPLTLPTCWGFTQNVLVILDPFPLSFPLSFLCGRPSFLA